MKKKVAKTKSQKFLVITEDGRIVGTQPLTEPKGRPRVTAALQAGPGQKLHELEIELPKRLKGAKEIEAFHQLVASRLELSSK